MDGKTEKCAKKYRNRCTVSPSEMKKQSICIDGDIGEVLDSL